MVGSNLFGLNTYLFTNNEAFTIHMIFGEKKPRHTRTIRRSHQNKYPLVSRRVACRSARICHQTPFGGTADLTKKKTLLIKEESLSGRADLDRRPHGPEPCPGKWKRRPHGEPFLATMMTLVVVTVMTHVAPGYG